jgi:Leucine-rich repeat (LRR) protein
MKKCNPGYYAGTSTPIYIPMDNGKQMGWTTDGTPCSFKPKKTTSSGYSNGWVTSISNYSSPIQKLDEAMRKLPESTPYVGRDFVSYTQPFVQPDIPHYIPPNKELSTSEKKLLTTDFIKILRDLYPKDYSQHIDSWPNTLWGKQIINRNDFQAIENFFVTEFVDVLHKRYPHDYPANFKDWNSKNSQWGKEVILTKNFKTIGKWLPAYQKEVLEQQKVLKNDFVEILHRVYPEDYPMNFKDWNNIWGKEVLERGDFEAIEKHLPSYKKQALEKEQNILFLVKDESDVYLGGMSIGDYGVKLIIGGVANKLTTLNLANNKIRDEGAKLLADSLSKGQMPNLKKLHLEGNKITDKGISYFPFAIDKMNQDIKVSLLSTKESLYTSYKLSALGDKNIKKEMLVDILQKATEIGLDVDNISIDRTTWGFIKNKVKVSRDFVFGVAKCLIPKNGKELLTDMIVEKTPKIIKTPVSYLELADCASEGIYYSRLTEAGVALTKHELELLGNNSEGSVYENIFIGIKDLFDELQ